MTRALGDNVTRLRAELARLQTLDPFQVLNITPDSDASSVRSAYLTAVKKVHPNRFACDGVEARDAATELFLVVRRAYGQLGDDGKRKLWRDKVVGPAPPAPPTVPERAAQPAAPRTVPAKPTSVAKPAPPRPRGTPLPARPPEGVRALLEEAKTRGARFEQARQLASAENHAGARVLLQKLVDEDPKNRKYRLHLHHMAGVEHQTAGRLDDAIRELERAAAIAPENAEVGRALAKAKELRDAGRGGIFSKLFGR